VCAKHQHQRSPGKEILVASGPDKAGALLDTSHQIYLVRLQVAGRRRGLNGPQNTLHLVGLDGTLLE
jgi:hypothetical protein